MTPRTQTTGADKVATVARDIAIETSVPGRTPSGVETSQTLGARAPDGAIAQAASNAPASALPRSDSSAVFQSITPTNIITSTPQSTNTRNQDRQEREKQQRSTREMDVTGLANIISSERSVDPDSSGRNRQQSQQDSQGGSQQENGKRQKRKDAQEQANGETGTPTRIKPDSGRRRARA